MKTRDGKRSFINLGPMYLILQKEQLVKIVKPGNLCCVEHLHNSISFERSDLCRMFYKTISSKPFSPPPRLLKLFNTPAVWLWLHFQAKKLLVGLSSNLVSKLNGASRGPIKLWARSAEFRPFPGFWLVKKFPRSDKPLIGLKFCE